ncbi:MAG: hypothetical protein HC824_20950 [Synechococcales cyanobacterium RM1_1_8]|nr:hypothetical protein [Oscillatoriales cyanobacterium SM2_3_0]NJN32604.1 hypothetical protein [Synechococcales cyanobacterium RM1_1_8]NJO47295.1 hypothetical protein [Oscillatoriales cyanobacterium RM2_1_1]
MSHALNLEDWSLSSSAIALLTQELEIISELAIARQRSPFPAGYTPAVIDVLFDDVLFIRSDRGQITFLRPCSPNYQPPFVKVRFDDQMALFLIQGEIVVNRIQAMAELDQLLGRLTPSPRSQSLLTSITSGDSSHGNG